MKMDTHATLILMRIKKVNITVLTAIHCLAVAEETKDKSWCLCRMLSTKSGSQQNMVTSLATQFCHSRSSEA